MKKYQFVTGHYNDIGSITVYARDENYVRHELEILGFPPYFYVLEKEWVPENPCVVEIVEGFKAVDGEDVKKIIMRKPTDVRDFRDKFTVTYEADIRFIRRFLIDTKIKAGFTTLKDSKVLRYTDLKPIDFMQEPKVVIFDIEVKSQARFPDPDFAPVPIICATIWDSESKMYITLLLDPSTKKIIKVKLSKNHHLIIVPEERKLIKLIIHYLKRVKGDLLTGWNVWFDIKYLRNRAKRFGLYASLRGFCIFDLLTGYTVVHKRLGNRLKEVVIEDEITDEVVSEEYHVEMYLNPETRRTTFVQYNKMDVEYCVKINEKRNITSFFWGLKNQAGLENLEGTTYHGVLIDTLFLREANGKVILPTAAGVERKKIKGAEPFVLAKGIYEGVGTFDMSRYYPNILMSYNIGGIAVQVCEDLMLLRDEYERRLAEIKSIDDPRYKPAKALRDEAKFLLNSVWGVLGWVGCRIYRIEDAKKVLEKARLGLDFVKKVADARGYILLAGDTDSIIIQVGEEDTDSVATELNKALDEFCESENIPKNMRIKLDCFAKKAVFTGVIKRRAEHIVWEGGRVVDYIKVTGFENVRRDSSNITRKVQLEVLEAILRKGTDGIKQYIRKTIKDIKTGKYPLEDVAIRKQIKLKVSEGRGDYYSGARWSNKYLGLDLRAGDQVKMVFPKFTPGLPKASAICFLEADQIPKNIILDWDRLISRTIQGKVEELLNLADIRWRDVLGRRKLSEVAV